MIGDGGTINFSGKCHNINVAMGGYILNSLIISIPMGGSYVIWASNVYNHWEQWL